MSGQKEKFEKFKALHQGPGAFVMPNPWDAGSAILLESLGFKALATTSAGYAFSKGKRNSAAALSRDELLGNAAEIVNATALPVSADLENGFGRARKAAPTRFGRRRPSASAAARSRMPAAMPRTRSMISPWRSSACRPRPRLPAASPFC